MRKAHPLNAQKILLGSFACAVPFSNADSNRKNAHQSSHPMFNANAMLIVRDVTIAKCLSYGICGYRTQQQAKEACRGISSSVINVVKC